MNQMFSPLQRRVDLAVAPPFALGGLRVCPNALEVHGSHGIQTLEPRVMQVLVALHRARGEPVSRDELSEFCWEGRVVGEDALNRCVVRLRRALAGEPRATIDTIPKIGYRLRVTPPERATAEPSAPPPPPPSEAAPSPPARGFPRSVVLAVAGVAAIAILGAGATAWRRLRPASTWSAEAMRPLTAEPGVEANPALSPDGRFLVYTAGPGFYGQHDVFMRGVNEGAPLRLTGNPAHEAAPAWAPSGDRIAFVRVSRGEPCRIVVLPIPRGAERTVGRCSTAGSTALSWLDERTILLADRASPSELSRIRAMDVETGAVRDITRPTAGSLGDGTPLPSPDGGSVVFRRSYSPGVQHLYLADARTGAERPLIREGWKALGYAWAPDGRTLFYNTNRGGDFGLWSLDTRGNAEPKRVSVGLRPAMNFGRLSADRTGRLAVETYNHRWNLFTFSGAGEPAALTATNGRDWDPDVAQHGGLVFISDQTGSPEVWMRPDGGEPTRLTRLRASFVQTPRWSPDGRRFVFILDRDGQTDLWLLNGDGSGLSRITRDGAVKADPVWDADGRALVYAERRGPDWRLLRVSTSAGEPVMVPGGDGFRALRPGWDGALYGLKAGDKRLWRLPRVGGVASLVSLTFRVEDGWATGPAGVYQVRGGFTPTPSLWLRSWSGEERKLADLPIVAENPSVAVDPRTGALLFPRMLRDESDIALLDLRART